MEKVEIKDIFKDTPKYLDKEVSIEGWVKTVRDSKTFGFIEVNDGTFFNNLQIVFNDTLDNFADVCKLTISSTIIVEGKIVKTENAKQAFEMHAVSIKIFNLGDSTYPLQKRDIHLNI